MTYRGHVEHGKIILEDGADLADGTSVEVRPVQKTARRPATRRKKQSPTLYERLKRYAGKAEGLPPDASTNLDHHLYGLPKRK